MIIRIVLSRRGCVTFDAVDGCIHGAGSNGTNAITDFELASLWKTKTELFVAWKNTIAHM